MVLFVWFSLSQRKSRSALNPLVCPVVLKQIFLSFESCLVIRVQDTRLEIRNLKFKYTNQTTCRDSPKYIVASMLILGEKRSPFHEMRFLTSLRFIFNVCLIIYCIPNLRSEFSSRENDHHLTSASKTIYQKRSIFSETLAAFYRKRESEAKNVRVCLVMSTFTRSRQNEGLIRRGWG